MRKIDPYLNEKLNSSMQTPANNSDPKMNVLISRARSTVMDSDYWTVETIREGNNLSDVSVAPRRFKPYGTPNRIYEIHVNDGQVGTSVREYPDKLKDGFVYQFGLGAGSSVGIAFDGEWKKYRKLWRLVTEDKPWIFWIDDKNILWKQYWDEEDTKRQIDVGVKSVQAIRAWKSIAISEIDQGLIVGYIKQDGTVWYTNYCRQADRSYIWEGPRRLEEFTGIAVSLNLFITNDYRMGFAVEDNLKQIHWLITVRDWAGMAVEQDKIIASPKAKVQFIPVIYHKALEDEIIMARSSAKAAMLFARTDNTVVSLENIPTTRINEEEEEYQDWGFKVRIRLNFETMNIPTFHIVVASTMSSISIASIEVIDHGYEYLLTIDDIIHEFGFNGVEGDMSLSVSNFSNAAGYDYEMINILFTPINLIPPAIPLPEVEGIWNE